VAVEIESWTIGRKERRWETEKEAGAKSSVVLKGSTEHPSDWMEDGANHGRGAEPSKFVQQVDSGGRTRQPFLRCCDGTS
jgi:hypothetical protein